MQNLNDTSDPGAVPNSADVDRRMQRITEYSELALNNSDPLEANLGAVIGDLNFLAYQFRHAIDNMVEENGQAPVDNEHFVPTVEIVLKVHRQIERLTKIMAKREADTNVSALLLNQEAKIVQFDTQPK